MTTITRRYAITTDARSHFVQVPVPSDALGVSLPDLADCELVEGIMGEPNLTTELKDLCERLERNQGEDKLTHAETVLDWAAHIRIASDLTWAQALAVASVWYFG